MHRSCNRGRARALALVAALAGLVGSGARADEHGRPESPLGPAIEGTARSALAVTDSEVAEVAADLRAFDPASGEAEPFAWTLEPGDLAWEGERVYLLRFPTPRPTPFEANNTVWCRFYPARDLAPGARAPLAIVLHHLGGDFSAEAILADFLARSGVHALEVEFPYYGPRKPAQGNPRRLARGDPGIAVELFRQGIADVRRATDWALARPDVDPERVGTVGISLGGIIGSLTAGVDPRLKRNVFIIAGADLATILLHDSREMREVRAYCAEHGIGRDELAEIVRPIEPARFAHRIDRRGALMLNALEDEVIPRPATDALIAAIGEPTVHWYPTGHYTVTLFLLDLFQRCRDHFLAPALPGLPAEGAGAESTGR
jgi:dienelactone hydrolase